jgi:hypothetical protein
MWAGRRKQALVPDDLVVAQTNVVDGIFVVELVPFQPVCASKVLPSFFVDEYRVPEAKDALHQFAVTGEFSARNNQEHDEILVLLKEQAEKSTICVWVLWAEMTIETGGRRHILRAKR